jgi:hypothetical protein
MKALLMAAACLAVAAAAAAQDQLSAARDLYASAAYEEALSALTRLHEGAGGAAVSDQVDQYRAFCLFALGRTIEAQSIAEALISKSPLVEIETADASPRIVAMFADVRKRLLPGLIRDRYRAGRAAVDKKDFAAAKTEFAKVGQMLDEAQKVGVQDETLGDLRVLVDGFAELAQGSLARAAAPAPVPPQAASVAAAQPPPPPKIYAGGADGVSAPIAVRQDIPRMPRELLGLVTTGPKSTILDIVIDENGTVERAVVRQSAVRMYDGLLISATRNWKYRPAMKGTTPVKYLKTIEIVVRTGSAEPPTIQ